MVQQKTKTKSKTKSTSKPKSKQKSVAKKSSLALVIVAVVAIVALLLSVAAWIFPVNNTKDVSWECVQTVCTELMSEAEIEAQVCSQTDQGMVCSLEVDGQVSVIPREELNFTGLQLCKAQACIKEVQTRPANYSLE
ncbi:hypothetical protein K9M74_00210 [Candidatus Woesearchaeota archaeon]|nr:hypothetical protein [Candidatus Woesearchaeota archaeon]